MTAPAGAALAPAQADYSSTAARLPLRVRLGWGLGTVATGTFVTGGFLLMRFMTDYMAIPAAVAGLLFALSKVYDGIVDPSVGAISDRTRTRIGRRRPYLLIGGVGMAVIFALAFNVPILASVTSAIVMMSVVLLIKSTCFALFNVPYLAMPAEITRDPHERSVLMSFRTVGTSIGAFLGGFGAAAVIAWAGGGLTGHRVMGLFIGAVVLLAAWTTFWMTAGTAFTQPTETDERAGFRDYLRTALSNKPFVTLQVAKIFLLTAGALHTGTTAFFVQRSLQLSDWWMGTILACVTVGNLVSQPFWLALVRRHRKRDVFSGSALFTACAWSLWVLASPTLPLSLVVVFALLAGIGYGGMVMTSQSMLPDTIEYDRRTSGLSREGAFAGLYSVVEKLGMAAGTAIAGIVYGWFGYVAARGATVEQPASAILGITLCYSVIAAAFLVVSAAAMRFYPLDEREWRRN